MPEDGVSAGLELDEIDNRTVHLDIKECSKQWQRGGGRVREVQRGVE